MLNNFYNVDQRINISSKKKYLSYKALIFIISSFILIVLRINNIIQKNKL
jgi:hypothetical protein